MNLPPVVPQDALGAPGTVCPYCKAIGTRTQRVVCTNCRNYSDAVAARVLEEEERNLLKQYRFLPWNWREHDRWKNDPLYAH